ncbi:VOC family protein [Deminuibacter soli]|uniref:Ring-cleaving dioxygenase n=1 Tax=Deminuibacter soli TaxID=2291815 RepID=A0A3E1NG39_9BACT|nr:VOC family protein [Deminuibacter soli]RFM26791.1 ring-cleaving dioxygenase [Deminuibacter soli]
MSNISIPGLHHITGVTANVQHNYHFYTKVLGLRLVKKTVHTDDPGAYHLFYGNKQGGAGTVLSFFPWEGLQPPPQGSAMAGEIGFAVPAGSFAFWIKRFKQHGIRHGDGGMRFGMPYLWCYDPDGLQINLVAAGKKDKRSPWEYGDITGENGIKGLNDVTLAVQHPARVAGLLTGLLNYTPEGRQGSRCRYRAQAASHAAVIDLVDSSRLQDTPGADNMNCHIAFRVKDEAALMACREKMLSAGLCVSEKIDNHYFYSLYFREPGGLVFELATDNPGFDADEPVTRLGSYLHLPEQYEPLRAEIENVLPVLA